uniref:Large ribosomal subunit protein bL20c n=1 Tax=Triphora wagneri TaxID=2594492 RepID=A0AAU7ANF5_9ASPA
MTRVKRGYTARRRRKEIRLFASTFLGAHSRLTRTTTQQRMRALVSSHRDRSKKKRDFRRLWITRLNAVTRENILFSSYSLFIHNLYKRELLLNRKILAQIALAKRNCFYMIFKQMINIKNINKKEDTNKRILIECINTGKKND